jgi:hypothetical protein
VVSVSISAGPAIFWLGADAQDTAARKAAAQENTVWGEPNLSAKASCSTSPMTKLR